MKGIEGQRLQRRGAEDGAVRSDEYATGVHEKAPGMQIYVNEFVKKSMVVKSLVNQEFGPQVAGNVSAAENFARINEFHIPKDVKEMGMDYEIAFVLQLAEELSKPEYNQ